MPIHSDPFSFVKLEAKQSVSRRMFVELKEFHRKRRENVKDVIFMRKVCTSILLYCNHSCVYIYIYIYIYMF